MLPKVSVKNFGKIKIIRQLINRIDFNFTFTDYKIKIEYVIEANLCCTAIKEVEWPYKYVLNYCCRLQGLEPRYTF